MGETPNYQTLQVRKEGPVYWLNLDRPERLNALNATMVEKLNDYLERLMTDASKRMMVMRGGGRAFFSGVDNSRGTRPGASPPPWSGMPPENSLMRSIWARIWRPHLRLSKG